MGFREEWKWGATRIRRDNHDRGYWLDGELRVGFPDNPKLSPRERLTIARWAEAFTPESLSPEQERLLAEAPPPPSFLPIQAGFAQNQLDLRAPGMRELYDLLGDEEKEAVRDPSCSPRGQTARYPLTADDIAAITGATESKIRNWVDEGLIPSFREGNDHRFYSAALIRAFVLQRTPTHSKAVVSAAARGKAA